jgi:putative transcriptional regulator
LNTGSVRNRLRLARAERDMTQAELAEKVGVTRQTIGLIEGGEYNPTLRLCLLIAAALGKGLDEIFWLEDAAETGNRRGAGGSA